jgi:phosphoribosyl 1,2-cyclic phosphodiesterase
MKIKIWGCRGSIATPGPNTLRYGGNSTCLEIRSVTGQVFVVDAGSGLRQFGKALLQEPDVTAIRFFLTHPHWDHLAGFPFFQPAYLRRYSITFCSGAHEQDALRKYLTRQMVSPYFPIDFKYLKARLDFRCDAPQKEKGHCRHGSMEVLAFPLNHPNGGYGFKFIEGKKTFVFLTDNELGYRHKGGCTRRQYAEFCRDADLLFHDAQYTTEEYRRTRGWGHSTYDHTIEMAMEAGVRRLGLFHHDPDRTDDDLDRCVAVCREQIHKSGSSMDCFPCTEGMTLTL